MRKPNPVYMIIKRLADIILASVALIVLLPILMPVCIVLLLTGEHQVLYFQERIGKNNRKFKIWKFATMLKNSPNLAGGLHTRRQDPRVLPFGRFLRMTKINELPQLVNILIGDMSIVGPRPLVDKTFDPYPDYVKERIYTITPGLTGIGSIVFRDEEKLLTETKLPADEFYAKNIAPLKGDLELWYQDSLSFSTDFKIVLLTAIVILFPNSDLIFKFFPDLRRFNLVLEASGGD